YINLFVEEYKKLNPNGRLAALFAASNPDRIKINDPDDKVISAIRQSAYEAFDNTFRVLHNRIDQFGVAQPNINPDRTRGIITVELPGIQDPERVRKYLQSSANLQFWDVYKLEELQNSWLAADKDYGLYSGGTTATDTTSTANAIDTTSSNKTDTSKNSSLKASIKKAADSSLRNKNQRSLFQDYKIAFNEGSPLVQIKDTSIIRELLNTPIIRKDFPADAKFAYGIPPRDAKNKQSKYVPLYVLRTKGSEKAPIEGDAIASASQTYDPITGRPTVSMDLKTPFAHSWES